MQSLYRKNSGYDIFIFLFSANSFTQTLRRVRYLKELQAQYHYLISIDGGINDETSKLAKDAGVDVIIVGTYLANNLNKKTMDDLR